MAKTIGIIKVQELTTSVNKTIKKVMSLIDNNKYKITVIDFKKYNGEKFDIIIVPMVLTTCRMFGFFDEEIFGKIVENNSSDKIFIGVGLLQRYLQDEKVYKNAIEKLKIKDLFHVCIFSDDEDFQDYKTNDKIKKLFY